MASDNNHNNETFVLIQLIHNGVLIPPAPEPRGLTLTVRGQPLRLTPKQEEMALAWAKKQGTAYVEDGVFVRNFMLDFSAALGLNPPLAEEDVDFAPALRIVEEERAAKASLSKEERKTQAATRKAAREVLKEQYGHAMVNGERTELGNYMTEPSGIFMGRGKHPLRGRWKEGAQQSDVTLNLSPDAPRPPGDWQEIVWQPDGLWVARWKDRFSDKMKYVWLGDTASAKQAREAQKFDKSITLHGQLPEVRAHIERALSDADAKRRMVATACYLIDALGLRVGDEKDPDEADTVGATTLRPEHVVLHDDGVAEFRFLGKDSVLWHKKLPLPEVVQRNLAELMQNARPPNTVNRDKRLRLRLATRDKPQLFPTVSSRDVNNFLGEALPGLTAKVFRTHHATEKVEQSLAQSGVQPADPEYAKWQATNMANLEAAMFCNHTKKVTANWASRKGRFVQRQRAAEERVERQRAKAKAAQEALSALRKQAREKIKAASPKGRRDAIATSPKMREKRAAAYAKRIASAERKVAVAQERLDRAQHALGKLKAQALIAGKNRNWNLTTSLKSYVDPRVLYRWGQEVGYDVLERYYSATLRRKFSWVRQGDAADEEQDS
jgi:DNA topoisomerase-1